MSKNKKFDKVSSNEDASSEQLLTEIFISEVTPSEESVVNTDVNAELEAAKLAKQLASELHQENHKLTLRCAELEKENAELRRDLEVITSRYNRAIRMPI